jgi:ferredoxin-NADP reductase
VTSWPRLRVAGAATSGEVRTLRLVAPDRASLPSFTPGSHVVVEVGERANAYSLIGGFIEPTAYEISVLRLPDGRGGSARLHEQVSVGDELAVSPPRSAFAPIASARHHMLVAGGIGITPILSHVRAARLFGRSFEVLYAHRAGASAPLVDELTAVCGTERLRIVEGRDALAASARARLAEQPLGSVLYLCGPLGMIETLQTIATELGWPGERIHVERFSTAALEPGEPFTARLARSGRELRVPPGVSLLEALEAGAVEVPYLCRQGVCGECRVGVTAGRPQHRDLFLSDEERDAGDSIMCCVSRSHDPILELDL